MEEEQKTEPTEETPVEEPKEEEAPAEEEAVPEEMPVEEPKEESAPVEEETAPAEEAPVEEGPAEEAAPEEAPATCGCSLEETKSAEDMIRDIVNFINVKKLEEVEGATHRIEADTADQLEAKLKELAKKIGEICVCE